MGDVVNLQQYRKKHLRERSARDAQSNRIQHGLSKRERQSILSDREHEEKTQKGKRLDRFRDEDEPPPPV